MRVMGFASARNEDFQVILPPVLDEAYEFSTLRPSVGQVVVLDCGQVEHVSSIWASRWIQWVRTNHLEQQYRFRNCPRKFIEMLNYLDEFRPKRLVVESFALPYECRSCGHETVELLRRGRDYMEASDAVVSAVDEHPEAHRAARPAVLRIEPELNCDQCPGTMEIAVLENVYLRFLHFPTQKYVPEKESHLPPGDRHNQTTP
jgi:hypothetical protein